jgi:2-iminoacetate synthase ThiH
MKRCLSKSELIDGIKDKTQKAKPIVRDDILKSLNNKTKQELERMYKSVRVDKDRTGIRYSK